ncbi:MAG: chromate transporter, partial [Coprobacillus sp. 28_7]
MIYLKLFITFLEIGLVSFGGGYGMIALIREKVLINNWLTESEFLNFVGIAESTPGPIAVNMATFVGSSQAGVLGSLVATIGVVLPSFIIILIIASIFKNLLKYEIVKSILDYIKPAIVGLIIGTGLLLFI